MEIEEVVKGQDGSSPSCSASLQPQSPSTLRSPSSSLVAGYAAGDVRGRRSSPARAGGRRRSFYARRGRWNFIFEQNIKQIGYQ